jgi:homoserine kinase
VSLLHREIVVPGSTSNLGPGFDAIGIALEIFVRLRIAAVSPTSRGAIAWRFVDRPLDGENAIACAFQEMTAARPLDFPSLEIEVRSEIPMKSGLGSSAAAVVAGLRLYEALAGPQPLDDLLALATRLEGHPDNAAASLLGGLVVAAVAPDGRVSAVASPWPSRLQLIFARPRATLDTRRARAAVPATVSRADAVFNLQRAALFVQSIATGDTRVMREATRDRLHQPYRLALVPGLEQALALEHPSLCGVFLSGAGPAVGAIVTGDTAPVIALLEGVYRGIGLDADVGVIAVQQPFGK